MVIQFDSKHESSIKFNSPSTFRIFKLYLFGDHICHQQRSRMSFFIKLIKVIIEELIKLTVMPSIKFNQMKIASNDSLYIIDRILKDKGIQSFHM